MNQSVQSRFWLFPAGCGEKRISQPVRFLLTGSMDSRRYVLRFIGAQTYRKHRCQAVFFRQPGSSHFVSHTKSVYVYKKYLTRIYFSFTKSLVLNFKTAPCQKDARTSLERLANQRHPARTGAGNERLAMNTQTFQVPNSGGQSRSLKVEAIGDFSRGKIIPRIRIAGQWLERAGFKPGHRVQVFMEQTGSLSLRFVAQGREGAL